MLDLDMNVNYQTMHGQYLVINLHGDIDVNYQTMHGQYLVINMVLTVFEELCSIFGIKTKFGAIKTRSTKLAL